MGAGVEAAAPLKEEACGARTGGTGSVASRGLPLVLGFRGTTLKARTRLHRGQRNCLPKADVGTRKRLRHPGQWHSFSAWPLPLPAFRTKSRPATSRSIRGTDPFVVQVGQAKSAPAWCTGTDTGREQREQVKQRCSSAWPLGGWWLPGPGGCADMGRFCGTPPLAPEKRQARFYF